MEQEELPCPVFSFSLQDDASKHLTERSWKDCGDNNLIFYL
jgi:hypothetical protein